MSSRNYSRTFPQWQRRYRLARPQQAHRPSPPPQQRVIIIPKFTDPLFKISIERLGDKWVDAATTIPAGWTAPQITVDELFQCLHDRLMDCIYMAANFQTPENSNQPPKTMLEYYAIGAYNAVKDGYITRGGLGKLIDCYYTGSHRQEWRQLQRAYCQLYGCEW